MRPNEPRRKSLRSMISIKDLEAQTEAQDSWVRDFLLNLPNLPHDVGAGGGVRRR